MKVGITGQAGFIGGHLYNFLNLKEEIELVPFKRQMFEEDAALNAFVSSCDCIVHLAAMNRHEDPQHIYDVNVGLVKKMIEACEQTNQTPRILFSSSLQESQDNLYGKSKKDGRELFEAWASRTGAETCGMIIPNVFGPFGKPNYNSVVATFCHKVARAETPTIINDGLVKLIYINELIEEIYLLIGTGETGKKEISHRHELKVSELLAKLKGYYENYMGKGEFPFLESDLDLALFNTFRCYVPKDHYPRPFTKHEDDRGYFVEIVRANTSGQFSFSTTKPGITRGNHFHTRKAERFAVIKGKAKISMRKVDSDEVIDYFIDGDKPAFVDMPIWYTHNISNIGDEEMIALFWINEPYDPEDADTYFVEV